MEGVGGVVRKEEVPSGAGVVMCSLMEGKRDAIFGGGESSLGGDVK